MSDETVTVAYPRSVTDEDDEAQLQHPMLWAYVVRDPTGAICSHGHGKTRKECESGRLFTPPNTPMRHGLRRARQQMAIFDLATEKCDKTKKPGNRS